MNDSALIYQWLGYLSNPARKTEIHVELHPKKEIEFRAEYQQLTGHPLLLSGEKAPFYIWKSSVNKWGTQRRVYFFGEKESMPKTPDMFEVRTGRSKKSGHWRINSKDFLKIMFKNGFFIGNNTENSKSIKAKIPGRFIKHFNFGFKIATAEEFIEAEVRKYCNESGFRTFGEDIIAQLSPTEAEILTQFWTSSKKKKLSQKTAIMEPTLLRGWFCWMMKLNNRLSNRQ